MKPLLLGAALLLGGARLAVAQTVPLDPSQPLRGGSQNQTTVPPVNAALNQSTIQGPPEVQRTPTSYDAQPSRLPVGAAPTPGTPELSPTAAPDVREQVLVPTRPRRQSTDIVPSRSPRSRSDNVAQPQGASAPQPTTPR